MGASGEMLLFGWGVEKLSGCLYTVVVVVVGRFEGKVAGVGGVVVGILSEQCGVLPLGGAIGEGEQDSHPLRRTLRPVEALLEIRPLNFYTPSFDPLS